MERRPWTLSRALFVGTLVVGALDLADAFIFFGLRGVSPIRILQSIASGLLGRPAYAGGLRAGALGALLHFFNAFLIVGTYLLLSRRIPRLAERPWLYGPLYGVLVYLVMNQIVIPLSAAVVGLPTLPVVLNGLLIHAVGVGLPSALVAMHTTRRH